MSKVQLLFGKEKVSLTIWFKQGNSYSKNTKEQNFNLFTVDKK